MSLRISKNFPLCIFNDVRSVTRPSSYSLRSSVLKPHRRRFSSTRYAHTHRTLRPLQSSATLTALVFGVFFAGAGVAIWDAYTAINTPEPQKSEESTVNEHSPPASGPTDPLAMPVSPDISTAIPPGRPGNLTPDQEAKVKDLWYEIGKLCGQYTDVRPSLDGDRTGDDDSNPSPGKEKKKRRFGGLLGRKSKDSDSTHSGAADEVDDKHGSNKVYRAALQDMSQEELRNALWEFCKGDEPDANLCRYLRARKWNVHDALVMLISTIYWRERVMKLDQDVMVHGEEDAMVAASGEGGAGIDRKLGEDMITQLRMGKSFLHGVDKDGRPICFVRVRLHKGGEFSEQSLERLTVYMIETARFMLRPPTVDTAVILFDMSGFTLANMDYSPVKFMIKVFEANYPESLGAVLVHKAPWVFQGIWSVIKGWLDPVVASKIHFTKTIDDLSDFIPRANVPKDLGGDEAWEYAFVEPVVGENSQMGDKQALQEVSEERRQVVDQFEKATQEWVLGSGEENEVRARRQKLSQEMRETYWRMDPFIRSRSMYDRTGVIQEGGVIDFYPSERPKQQHHEFDAGADKMADGTFGAQALQSPVDAGSPRAGDLQSVKSVYFDAQSELD